MPNGIPPKLCVKPGRFFYYCFAPWGTSGYDRSGKCFRFDSNAGTAARRVVSRSAHCQNRAQSAVPGGARLRRPQIDGPRGWRLSHPRMDGARQGAGAQPERGGTAVNVCRHRQSIILKGHGRTHNIVCPLHRWTYDTSGRLLGAHTFRATPAWTWKRHLWPSGTACCSPVRAIRIWICRNWACLPTSTSQATCSTGDDRRIPGQLEDVHRSLSRGLSHRAISSGLASLSMPRI